MKIERLPSGSYRARVFLGTDSSGKKIIKSISGKNKKDVQFRAAQLQAEHREAKESETFSAATKDYFASHEAVLSPATIRSYKGIYRHLESDYPSFCRKEIFGLTNKELQRLIDDLSLSGLSPKTVSNYYGFIRSVLTYKDVSFKAPKLPGKEKPELHIPDEITVRRTLKAVEGTDLEIPVMLAAFGPLRRGEICALHPEDISGSVIHVHRDLVLDDQKQWVEKAPKTYTSDRWIQMPEKVIELMSELQPDENGHLIHMTPNQLSDRFRKALNRAGIEHYRFHDLRHFCASDLHARGVPDIYIMQRTGHSSPAVLHSVYTHTLQDQSTKQTEEIINHFDEMIK